MFVACCAVTPASSSFRLFAYGNRPGLLSVVLILLEVSMSDTLCQVITFLPPFQLSFQHKIGILYCKAGQSTEEEMYNNETAGPAFEEFLDLLGQRVRLKGFSKYRAQLDNKSKLHICVCAQIESSRGRHTA